jgi:hypothetical protein
LKQYFFAPPQAILDKAIISTVYYNCRCRPEPVRRTNDRFLVRLRHGSVRQCGTGECGDRRFICRYIPLQLKKPLACVIRSCLPVTGSPKIIPTPPIRSQRSNMKFPNPNFDLAGQMVATLLDEYKKRDTARSFGMQPNEVPEFIFTAWTPVIFRNPEKCSY